MKKLNLILSIICMFYINLNAQKITPEVISSSGDYFKQANGSLSWTIGESMTETYTNGNILTQGFQQSGILTVSVFEIEDIGISIEIGPNPTKDFINLYIDNVKDINYQLYDFNGKIIKQANIYSDKTMISFSEFSSAAYILTIKKGNQVIKAFQIIKQ